MERVFFNTLIIMKGVVLAYGATVLVELAHIGAPWESWAMFATYGAWTTTMLFVALTLVSQAFGSMRTPLHPSTSVILLTLSLNIAEVIAFALLVSGDDLPATIRPWFLAVAIHGGLGCVFVSIILHRDRSDRYHETSMPVDLRRLVTRDCIGAGATAVFALLVWSTSTYERIEDLSSLWVVILGTVALIALHEQQKKAIYPSGTADAHDIEVADDSVNADRSLQVPEVD